MSAQVHSHALPFRRPVPLPAHMGLEVGTELTHLEGDRWSFVQPIGLGWSSTGEYGHTVQAHTLGLVRFTASWGTWADAGLGVGYLHSFSGRQVLVQGESGWEPSADWGRPGLQMGLAMGLGQGFDVGSRRFRAGLRYRFFAQYPYLMPVAPFMAHSLLGLELGLAL